MFGRSERQRRSQEQALYWSGMKKDRLAALLFFGALGASAALAKERASPRTNLVLARAGNVEIVLAEGEYIARNSEDFNCWPSYYGQFIARVSLNGRTVESSLGERGVCAGPWSLRLQDYNHDGQPDFNIGIQENRANSFYELFTIGRDGKVRTLNVRHDDGSVDDSVTAETTGNSTTFDVTASGFRAKSRDNPPDPDVAYWMTLYEWKDGMFHERATIPAARSKK